MRDLTIIDIDETYGRQSFMDGKDCEWLNLKDLSQINLFCETSALELIAERLKERDKSVMTYIGSGNYHYISYLLLKEIKRPFTLVLLDHHTDTLTVPENDMITCGSWVLEAIRRLPFLQQVVIIGVSEKGLSYIPDSIQHKITSYTKEKLHSNFHSISAMIHSIPTDAVYISIDKDVLKKGDAYTAWDHGDMTLDELIQVIQAIGENKTVIGADVCGEYPISPTNAYERETRSAIRKNNIANRKILQAVKEAIAVIH